MVAEALSTRTVADGGINSADPGSQFLGHGLDR